MRGVINLRDKVIPLVDLRQRLGMPTYQGEIDELIELMNLREQDHRDWLTELENSVKEEREFTLATDHRQCAFGKWCDSYQPQNEVVERFLTKFQEPHQRIHQIAIHVEELVHHHQTDEAHKLIDQTRNNDLATMIGLFEQFRAIIQSFAHSEIALVIEVNGKSTALAVDSVESVEHLAEGSVETMPQVFMTRNHETTPLIAKRKETDELVMVLDVEQLDEEQLAV